VDRVDVLAVGAHPDDVELGCGATVAQLARAGRRVGILHLTGGEAGTRGTVEQRRAEAERAAGILGAAGVEFLDLGDGALRTGDAEEDAVIEVLRQLRPELVLGPTPADRHPDHGRAHRLLADACFYAGLARRGEGAPHRPAALFSYLQHDPHPPAFVVGVDATWELKMQALDAYESQLYRSERAERGSAANEPSVGAIRSQPPTKVASPEFRRSIEGRARHYGMLIGAEFGEPFWSAGPLAVADPWQLLPGGLR
jgi:bacillithiol biosynthesis deacetylase BshB1